MAEPFLGEIRMFAGNFAPQGWATCDGQVMPINQNQALFSLLGTSYGGNGTTNFALPDLRGRVPIHSGQGPGLSSYSVGQAGGAENVTLQTGQIPAHNHSLNANTLPANQKGPGGNALAAEPSGVTALYTDAGVNATMNPQSVGSSGGGQPHANIQPFLTLTFIIALQGIFPARN